MTALFPRLLAVAILLLASGGTLHAHETFEVESTARLRPNSLLLKVSLTQSVATGLLWADGGEQVPISPASLDSLRPRLMALAPRLYEVTANGALLRALDVQVSLGHENDVGFLLTYPRPPGEVSWKFDALLVRNLEARAMGSLVILDEVGEPLGSKIVRREDATLALNPPSTGDPADAPAAAPAASPQPQAWEFLKLGTEHILTGYDHLLFLAGLVLACRRFRDMVVLVTAFTIAHSLTLALAALEVLSLPGSLVEPLIAASIVYVGLENLVRPDAPRGRVWLAAGFGLIHGFGFASILRETGLASSASGVVGPLFSFNLGVELGQLAVAAILLPLLLYVRRWPRFSRLALPACSLLIAAGGWVWLVQRTILFS